MNEELLIKVKVDTSSVTTSINSLKNQVANVNKNIGNVGASSTSTASTNKMTKAMQGIEQSVKNIKTGMSAWDFTKAIAGINVFKKAVDSILDKLDGKQGHFSNAIASLIPSSRLYEDVEWEGWDGAWNNFNSNMLEGLSSGWSNVTDKSKNAINAIKNFKAPKSMAELSKTLENLGTKAGTTVKGGLSKATSSLKGLTSGATASAGAIAAAGAALTAFIAVLVAFIAVGVAAALSASKLGDEIYHSSQKFGFSSKAYQEWSYIMERNGSTIEDLKGFLETLASEQAAVVNGSQDAAKAFNDLGLSAQQVASMGQQELFEEVVKRLQNINDATKKSAIAYELFGDEASRLMNVLNMSNADMQKVIDNYHLLGGAMSGELVEKSNSLQNAIANMKQAWQGISNTLAEVFIPVVKAVVQWLTKAFVVVNLFLRSIFGLDLKASSKDTNGAASSTNKYTGSLKSATAAAKELKRVTMGFDELNIVGDPNKNSGSGSTGGGLDTSGIPTLDSSMLDVADLNLDKIYEWFEEYKGVIAQVTTWSLLLIGILLAVIGCFTANVPMVLLGAGMAGLGIAIGIKSGAFEQFAEAIKKVWNKISDWFKEKVAPVFTKQFWSEKWNKVVESTSEKVESIREKISEKWTGIKNWFKEHVAPIFTKKYWSDKFDNIKNSANEKLTETKNAFSEKWNGIKTWFKEHVGVKFTKKYWSDKFNSIKEGASNKLEEAKTAISDKWNGIKKWFSTNVGAKFTGTYWKEKFSSIPNGIKDAFNGAIGIVEKAVNAIIKKINTLSWEVPDWVPVIGGGKWGFNFKTISIPRLATGGITTRSTIANIGENGREAVLPLENNTQWMDALADRIAARNSAPTKVALVVDGKELGWATINGINNITEQTGSIQLTL